MAIGECMYSSISLSLSIYILYIYVYVFCLPKLVVEPLDFDIGVYGFEMYDCIEFAELNRIE